MGWSGSLVRGLYVPEFHVRWSVASVRWFFLVDCITASRWDSFGMKRGDGDCSGYSIFPGNDVERPVDYITIGDFIRKVRDAGYDYRLLDLRSVSDVFGVLDALERGDGLERFARKGALCSRISRKVECG